MTVSELQCDPVSADWGSAGDVHAYHELIVPGGSYSVQVISDDCDALLEENYSLAVGVQAESWGDLCGTFDVGSGTWQPPDGSVDVATDVVACLDKFANAATALAKTRCDLEPALPDLKINITDVVMILDAFGGAVYLLDPPPAPCGP